MDGRSPLQFSPEDGKVRLVDSEQLLFRVTFEGLVVWHKRKKRELLVPWPTLLNWRQTISSST
jgi:hypothetical protein